MMLSRTLRIVAPSWTKSASLARPTTTTVRQERLALLPPRAAAASSSSSCFSTASTDGRNTTSTGAVQESVASRLGVGSHKWATIDRKKYLDIVHTAIANGITTLEVGQEGGDVAMSEVLSTIASEEKDGALPAVELLQRVGYRTLTKNKEGMEGDVFLEDLPKGAGTVQHNISQQALRSALYESYLLHAPSPTWQTQRILMLHNPEVQASTSLEGGSATARQAHLQTVLTNAFLYLQDAILEQKEKHHNMTGYGVVSNGLGLPANHPLHLSWTDAVLPALHAVQDQLGSVDFRVIQLPVNLLETTGLAVAQQVQNDKASLDFLADTQVYAMRPLACFPDQGTGNGKPFVLADYQLPATMDKTLQWSHTMSQPPQAYQIALKTAMAHFDASEILEAKQRGEDLDTDQRETLDGCKLLQSLLHDVDQSLENVRSFAQHEEDLYNKIIPLIHDTFEGYDDETALILQSFFGAYSLAVRYAIAKNTRQVLVEGDNEGAAGGTSAPKYPDLSPKVRLQEYAIAFLLQAGALDKLLVGFSDADHILEDMDIVHQHYVKKVGKEA